ncbi:uncharacterized protein (TIGR02391 family) [Sphingomonas vulcanisoli]|uniref:Uncharacterized protein (TIGR02391 family) n=1 Tax=Sphingomonas vulcanisoli TaxID=1658060 RepID=A0ABX0TUH3_9SPHN|nr:TIGR02391 family protein [Sphingomonas vulcanisoli]NIJ08120.1 uncharacterized protein (TIGR02391 family) [Sphingomonas vulcanisoli]
MTLRLLEGIKRFQEHLLEVGLARSVLALPAPRMLALPSPTAEGSEPASVFARLITEPEIHGVASDLFASGHYNLSVSEAYKAVDKFVASRVPHLNQNGTSLMDQTFSPKSPYLRWTKMLTTSEQDEQQGYHRLFSGAMLGIRNPTTHEFGWVDEPELALELIVFAQHLLRKAKAAQSSEPKIEKSG